MILLYGGLPGNKCGIPPYLKPKDHPRWQAKYNDGLSFIRGRRASFAQSYTWAVCRDLNTKLGMKGGSLSCVESDGVNRSTCTALFCSSVCFLGSAH